MRFRSEWIWIPAALLLVAWILSTVDPAFGWTDITDALHVRHIGEYGKLAILGLTLIGIVTIVRVLKHNREDS